MKSRTQSRPAMDRGKWSQQGVPHKGWQFCNLTDLGDLIGTCEMCETQSIRYLHHMEHPDYDAVLGVGSVCAGHIEENYKAAQEREREAKSIAKRRMRWMKAPWKKSLKGNSYINRNGFNVVMYRSSGRWAYRIRERQSERSWSKSGFAYRGRRKARGVQTLRRAIKIRSLH